MALHDIEPATFERCALIRDWLADLGVDRLTLVVSPAADQHSPALAEWLRERRVAGDAVAHQGSVAGRVDDWWLAPGVWRAGAFLHKRAALRIDIRPSTLDRAARVRALESTLRRETSRRPRQALIASHSE